MEEDKKLILKDYYKRYRALGKSNEQISQYLLQNNFATKEDIKEISKRDIPYKLLAGIGTILLIILVLIFAIINALSGSDSSSQSATSSSSQYSYDDSEEEEVGDYRVYDEEITEDEEIEDYEEEKDTDIEEEEEDEPVQEQNNITNFVNSSKINLDDIKLRIKEEDLISNEVNISWSINNYTIADDDMVFLLYNSQREEFEYEDSKTIKVLDIGDKSSGDVIDDKNLRDGDNYYRLYLFIEAYDSYLYSNTLSIEFEDLPGEDEPVVENSDTVESNETVEEVIEPTFENLYDCEEDFDCYIEKISNNESAMYVGKYEQNISNINLTIEHSYEKMNNQSYGIKFLLLNTTKEDNQDNIGTFEVCINNYPVDKYIKYLDEMNKGNEDDDYYFALC